MNGKKLHRRCLTELQIGLLLANQMKKYIIKRRQCLDLRSTWAYKNNKLYKNSNRSYTNKLSKKN